MTTLEMREKLKSLIDVISDEKVVGIYLLLRKDLEFEGENDLTEAQWKEVEATRDEYLAGTATLYSREEPMQSLRQGGPS